MVKNIRRAGYVRTCQAKGIASRKVLNSVYGECVVSRECHEKIARDQVMWGLIALHFTLIAMRRYERILS